MAPQPEKLSNSSGREWDELKRQVRERWSEIAEEDLQQAEGDLQALIAAIQQKTGEARDLIEKVVMDLADDLRPQLHRAQEAVREGYDRAAAHLKEQVAYAQDTVRRRPKQSLAVAFGAGLVGGVVIAGLIHSSRG